MKAAKAVKHTVAGTTYIGANPVYQAITNPVTHVVEGYAKVAKGVPFKRVSGV